MGAALFTLSLSVFSSKLHLFEELSELFSVADNHHLIRDLLNRVCCCCCCCCVVVIVVALITGGNS